jgi:hypothetical protein
VPKAEVAFTAGLLPSASKKPREAVVTQATCDADQGSRILHEPVSAVGYSRNRPELEANKYRGQFLIFEWLF